MPKSTTEFCFLKKKQQKALVDKKFLSNTHAILKTKEGV